VMDVIDRVPALGSPVVHAHVGVDEAADVVRAYARENGEDPPEIRDWTWPAS